MGPQHRPRFSPSQLTVVHWPKGVMVAALATVLCVSSPGPFAAHRVSASTPRLAANSVTLNYWIAPEGSNDPQTYQHMFAGFHKLHPEVKAINMAVTPWTNVTQKELAAFAAGKGPDVISTGNDFFAPLVTQGDLISLDGRIGQIKDQLEPGVWPLIQLSGHIYGVPVDLTSWVLLYNRKELQQAGISHPPATWAELQADAIKLTKKDAHGNVTQWGFGIPSTFPYFVNFATAPLWQGGAQLMNKSQTMATFNSPEGQRGLQFFVDLYQKYHVAAPFSQYAAGAEQTAFFNGKIAMEISGPDQVRLQQTKYPKFPLGVAFNPAGPAGRQSVGAYDAYFISSKTQYKDLAWAWILWMMRKENNAAYTQSFGTPSARKDLANEYGLNNPLHVFNEDTVHYGFLPPRWTLEIWNDLDPLEEAAITGRLSVKAALDQAATKVDQTIQSQQ